jgi:nicotinate dehydrogenase subunit B
MAKILLNVNGKRVSATYDDPQMPEIVIELIDPPTEKPWGAGEPIAAVIPSAISNAALDATGVQLRSVPYTPAKVKAAMQAA